MSPLVSLMVDQVQSFRHRSVKSTIMSSVDKEHMTTKDGFQKCSLLFCSLEAIDVGNWRDVIAKPEISVAIVVDEAHSLSK